MKRPVILIPEPFPAGALDVVPSRFEVVQGDAARACSEDELIEALKGVSALAVTSREQVTARVIDRAPDLRVIGKSGARPANVDMDAARRRGIGMVVTEAGLDVGEAIGPEAAALVRTARQLGMSRKDLIAKVGKLWEET